jgi:hypothetical protein
MTDMLPLPKELSVLIEEGFWPRDQESVRLQHLKPLVAESIVRQFAPEESQVFLYPPPFPLVRTLLERCEKRFWSDPRSAIAEIDPDLTVLIGDFGLGSDAPLALDYRRFPAEPSLIRLRWAKEGNHWVEVAATFATFAAHLKR